MLWSSGVELFSFGICLTLNVASVLCRISPLAHASSRFLLVNYLYTPVSYGASLKLRVHIFLLGCLDLHFFSVGCWCSLVVVCFTCLFIWGQHWIVFHALTRAMFSVGICRLVSAWRFCPTSSTNELRDLSCSCCGVHSAGCGWWVCQEVRARDGAWGPCEASALKGDHSLGSEGGLGLHNEQHWLVCFWGQSQSWELQVHSREQVCKLLWDCRVSGADWYHTYECLESEIRALSRS